jgi:DNA-binding protein HU-beta
MLHDNEADQPRSTRGEGSSLSSRPKRSEVQGPALPPKISRIRYYLKPLISRQNVTLTFSHIFLSINSLVSKRWEPPVIKLDIINEVVNKTGITKTKAELAVETVFESMKRSLSKGDRIELRGFGVFNVRPRKTGIGRNPRTGAEVSIPPGKAVRFKPGKELQSID